jgi:hypothetical protein
VEPEDELEEGVDVEAGAEAGEEEAAATDEGAEDSE